MISFTSLLIVSVLHAGLATGNLIPQSDSPLVKLDDATFIGTRSDGISKFLGIPYAEPPIGDRRFRLPQPLPAYTGVHSVTGFGPSCPQQALDVPLLDGLLADVAKLVLNAAYKLALPDSEDCLTLNVLTPGNAVPGSKLPVLVWIHGGAFALGGASQYDGTSVVEKSIELGHPVIYVSMNYRLNAFGFLAGKEVKSAGVGNLGLHDQRLALRWVQKYVSKFGGDPTQVTIWGESAGAISVGLHMVAYNGKTDGLFQGAFMQSGSPIGVADLAYGQHYYDFLVSNTGCSGTSDTLFCLRNVKYDTLKDAIDMTPSAFSYQSLSVPWLPRTDGVLFTDPPHHLVLQGKVANIPFITGDCDDEGTLFQFSTLNITTNEQYRAYVKDVWLSRANDTVIDKVVSLYPEDITQGAPYDTGILYALTPQSKRISSIVGDAAFEAPRRFFLQQRSDKQKAWSFLSKRLKVVPFFGAFHGSDILNVYFGGDMADYLIRFAAAQDPNGDGAFEWPRYTTAQPNLLTFNSELDLFNRLSITQDTYRKDALEYISRATIDNPL